MKNELREVLGLLEKATPGEWKVRDENDGEGDHPRPLWCVENDALHDWDETGAPFQVAVNYGGKEDADLIAAAVNFLRKHGPALAAAPDDGWLPIESAPKDGTRVILAWDGPRVGYYLDNSATDRPWRGWKVPSMEPWPQGQPTHWRPLPAPPAARSAEEK